MAHGQKRTRRNEKQQNKIERNELKCVLTTLQITVIIATEKNASLGTTCVSPSIVAVVVFPFFLFSLDLNGGGHSRLPFCVCVLTHAACH